MTQPSLSKKAYEAIKADIITCTLKPGEQIAQPLLMEKYQIGMTPIREALHRLASEGFVRPIPRFGYMVSPITVSDVREIYELRSILETSAVRLAAQRGSQAALENLRKIADFTYTYGDQISYVRFLDLNAGFHLQIAEIAGNQRLADMISKVLDGLTRIFYVGLDLKDSAEEMRNAHIELASAILARDANEAERLVRQEIDASRERVLKALTRQLEGKGAADLKNSLNV